MKHSLGSVLQGEICCSEIRKQSFGSARKKIYLIKYVKIGEREKNHTPTQKPKTEKTKNSKA
jgi:hypothetical protein